MAIYFLLILIGIIALAFLPIQIHLYYQRINKEDKIKIKIKFLFVTFSKVLTTPLPKTLSMMARKKYTAANIQKSIKAEKLPEKNWQLIFKRIQIWFPRLIQIIAHSLKLVSRVFKPVKCKQLNIYNEIGLPDASNTGIAVGSLYAVYSFLLSYLSQWILLKPDIPKINIIPQFNRPKILLEYDCIITFPLGHIIIVLFQTARFIRVTHHLLQGIKHNL